MTTATRNYPLGDLRLSDADRDHALTELTEAFEVGRITADEFDMRCEQALAARTGNELTALLADLPHDRTGADATARRHVHRAIATWTVVGAAAAAAAPLAAVAVTNALSHATPSHYDRQLARQVLAHLGLNVRLPRQPAPPGFDWVGTITPAAIAVLLVVVIVVVLRRAGTCRRQPAAR